MIEEGLRVIRREQATNSGYIDLLCEDKGGTTVVVEVKRTAITHSAVYQLEAYLVDFKKKNHKTKVRGILCAPRVTEMAKNASRGKGARIPANRLRLRATTDRQTIITTKFWRYRIILPLKSGSGLRTK